MYLVMRGDRISIDITQRVEEIAVCWNQNSTERSEIYYNIPFYNKTRENQKSFIFVQKCRMGALLKKRLDDGPADRLEFIVDYSYQFGQDKERENRWLVWHDKENLPYQWRFWDQNIASWDSKRLREAMETHKITGYGDLKNIRAQYGDYLHEYPVRAF